MMRCRRPHPLLRDEKIRYVIAGVWNTFVGCALFATLYFLLADKIHYLAVAVISHLLSVLNAWLTYRRLVFKSRAAWFPEYFRFNLSSLFVLLFQVCTLWMSVDILGMRPVLSQVCIVVLTVILGYLIHANFSFLKSSVKNSDAAP